MHRESPIHVALRLGSLDAVKMLLQSSSFDIVKCDSVQRSKVSITRSRLLLNNNKMLEIYLGMPWILNDKNETVLIYLN